MHLEPQANAKTRQRFFIALFANDAFPRLLLVYRDAWRVYSWQCVAVLVWVACLGGLLRRAGRCLRRHGDMSVAYPLARSLPVILIAILTGFFGLGKPLSTIGIIGILAVVIGCLLLPLQSLRQVRLSSYLTLCCVLAVVAAVGTTGYTLVDNQAIFDLRSSAGIPLSNVQISFFYLALLSVFTAILMGGYILLSSPERLEIKKVWKSGKGIALLTGVLIMGTYGLVLTALAYTTNVSYIAAFRQLSIPLGAILGILVLKEPAYPPKLASIGVIFAGLVLIALA
jgi:drug/metabolite transporter (DMT)-like permease